MEGPLWASKYNAIPSEKGMIAENNAPLCLKTRLFVELFGC